MASPKPTPMASEKRPLDEDSRVPVTVITGFLGAGKTTLVNYILTGDHGKKIAVVENEFGEVGIDDALVINAQEEILEMNNGCICCTVRGDLIKILTKLVKRRASGAAPLDAVLIETTGLADPAPVAQTFFVDDFIKSQYRLDAIVTLVDGRHLIQHLDDEKPEGVENEAIEQLAFADKIVLNKCDLVNDTQKEEVLSRIKKINASAEIIETVRSRVEPLDRILGVRAFDLSRVLEAEPDFLEPEGQEHQHDSTVTSVGLTIDEPLDGDKLNMWLSKLLQKQGADLFRSKGVLNIKGAVNRYVFQGVHMLMSFGGSGEDDMEEEPDTDDEPDQPKTRAPGPRPWLPDEKRSSRIVFIGRNLDRAALEKGLRACIA